MNPNIKIQSSNKNFSPPKAPENQKIIFQDFSNLILAENTGESSLHNPLEDLSLSSVSVAIDEAIYLQQYLEMMKQPPPESIRGQM